MAIASGGTLGTGASSTSNSSWTFNTATNTLASGDFGILVIVTDNRSTADGATNDHTTVSGGTGNWTKLGEYTNTVGGAAADGVCTSVWLFEATGTVNTATTITMGLSGNATDKACSFWKFTKAAGKNIAKTSGITNPVNNGTDASNGFGSVSFSGLSSASRLYFRGLGKEANSTTDITVSANFTAISPTRSRNNAAAVIVRGEFRVNTSTGETSNPTLAVTGDTAAVFLALEEYTPINISPTVGSATVSGNAPSLYKVIPAPVSGGMTAAGAATTLKTKAFLSSGGMTAAGAATTSYTAGTSVYVYAGTGGMTAAGAATLAKEKTPTASGGMVAGGVATTGLTSERIYAGSGGIATDGAATVSVTKAYTADGGVVAAGAALTEYRDGSVVYYDYIASGGIQSGGEAVTAYETGYAPPVYGGIFSRPSRKDQERAKRWLEKLAARVFSYIPIGGVHLSGGGYARFVRAAEAPKVTPFEVGEGVKRPILKLKKPRNLNKVSPGKAAIAARKAEALRLAKRKVEEEVLLMALI